MKTPVAYLFPGQGAQEVGMGQDLYVFHPAARETFEEADDVLGFALSTLCFEGPKHALDETINTQPALYVTGIALWRVARAEGLVPDPTFVAGHSLGEYSALTAAGALPFAAGVRLVRERGRLMKQAGDENPGGMAAIIALDDETVAELCAEVRTDDDPVQVANYNCPGQVVISGATAAVERAVELADARGARKTVVLDVSIAAHSRLMAPIADAFAAAVDAAELQDPAVPVVANLTARPMTTTDEIRRELVDQLTNSVLWTDSVGLMRDRGIETFVEFGPGTVLTGLVKRIDRKAGRVSVAGRNDIDALRSEDP